MKKSFRDHLQKGNVVRLFPSKTYFDEKVMSGVATKNGINKNLKILYRYFSFQQ